MYLGHTASSVWSVKRRLATHRMSNRDLGRVDQKRQLNTRASVNLLRPEVRTVKTSVYSSLV